MSSDHPNSSAHFREPDIVVWNVHNPLTAADIDYLYGETIRASEQRTHVFTLILVSKTGGMDSGARRRASQPFRRPDGSLVPIAGTVIVGASFQLRIIGNMVAKAWGVLSKTPPTPILFVDTEDEALAWIDGLRKEITQKTDDLLNSVHPFVR